MSRRGVAQLLAHGCQDKIKYVSRQAAQAALERQGLGRKRSGPRRQAYCCQFCSEWHTGHKE